MALTVYRKVLLAGGGATALDGIDGAILLNLDECTVYQSGIAYTYVLNATSGAADDGLNIIAPDTNPGTKRWILQSIALANGAALGTPASGVMTNTTTATAADNDATTKLASTAFAKSQDAVLARDPDQSVALTAAGIAAMKVTHSATCSNTTNSHGLGGKFALPLWTPAATQVLVNKWAANVGYKIEVVLTSGIFRLTLNATVYDSTVTGGGAASNLLAGSAHSILAIPRVGATTTAVDFMLDDVLLNTTAAQANVDVTNTQDLYIGGTSAVTYAMTVYDFYHFNLAPTVTEWRLAYLEGIPESWKCGSQTAKYASDFSTDANGFTNAASTITGNIDGIGGQNDVLRVVVDNTSSRHGTLSPGILGTRYKKVRIKYDYYIPSTNTDVDGLNTIDGSVAYGNIGAQLSVKDAWTTETIEKYTPTGSDTFNPRVFATKAGNQIFQNVAGTDVYYIKNFTITVIGATLALGPESWQSDKPYDCSGNNLVCSYPATGWSLTRPNAKKLWQPTPTAETTAVTLTIAKLLTGIITATHTAGATQAYTLPTGALCDAWPAFGMDRFFDWTLINLSAAAADTVTVTAAATGHTIVGNPIVQSAYATTGGIYGNSAMFRTRKTAANTFVTYRIS